MAVLVGEIISAVADGTMIGVLVGDTGDVGSTVGIAVALEHAVIHAKRIGRNFFINDVVRATRRIALTHITVLTQQNSMHTTRLHNPGGQTMPFSKP